MELCVEEETEVLEVSDVDVSDIEENVDVEVRVVDVSVMVEVSEAVAQHWLDVRLHYIFVVMGYLHGAFLYMGFVVKASGRA